MVGYSTRKILQISVALGVLAQTSTHELAYVASRCLPMPLVVSRGIAFLICASVQYFRYPYYSSICECC